MCCRIVSRAAESLDGGEMRVWPFAWSSRKPRLAKSRALEQEVNQEDVRDDSLEAG